MDSTKLRTFFDIDSTVSWINNHGYRRVALQFPDSLLSLSSNIATLLEKECNGNAKTYILADTTYRRYVLLKKYKNGILNLSE